MIIKKLKNIYPVILLLIIIIYCTIRIIRIMRVRHLHFGVSGRRVTVRNFFVVRARPVKGLLVVYRNLGSVARKFLRFLFISDISIFSII